MNRPSWITSAVMFVVGLPIILFMSRYGVLLLNVVKGNDEPARAWYTWMAPWMARWQDPVHGAVPDWFLRDHADKNRKLWKSIFMYAAFNNPYAKRLGFGE